MFLIITVIVIEFPDDYRRYNRHDCLDVERYLFSGVILFGSLRVVIVCGVNDLLARLVSVFHFPFCVFFRHG